MSFDLVTSKDQVYLEFSSFIPYYYPTELIFNYIKVISHKSGLSAHCPQMNTGTIPTKLFSVRLSVP